MGRLISLTAIAAVVVMAFSVVASADVTPLPPPGASNPSAGGGESGGSSKALTMAQAKAATKKEVLKYQGGVMVQVTKVDCKRTPGLSQAMRGKSATCKYELRAPERCRGTFKVTKTGSKVRATNGTIQCQIQNPDGTLGWERAAKFKG
jgi:hypothetical protein